MSSTAAAVTVIAFFVREQAETTRQVDELELLYSLPAYDPAWAAGMERLWDAIRDEQQKEADDA